MYNAIMPNKRFSALNKQYVLKTYGEDNELYGAAINRYRDKKYVSSGSLQRDMQVAFCRARYVLDRMIENGFCEPQGGAKPCKVIRSE